MLLADSRSRLTAVLGPTNTGKTYLAVERMLGHRSGMIGFPLRLLARENYDRIVALRGARAVALVTGEEKILPPNPSYFVCTVESMPLDRRVSFLAVDEIQMAADPERGHIFTDRLLHARGLDETMFLGAETARPLIRELVPGVEFITRPRFSKLAYTGYKKVTRLPPRSAVVAFSAAEVYRLAELVRRQRGGTAVVLGALSPRARNAQVGLYQAGEVDYLVATDAIGMGLNMDVRHVAFSSLVKFDGRYPRRLSPAEVAQIAGRAGRHMSDGTFGATADLEGFEEELVEAIEEHRFDPLRAFMWRNSDLEFRSLDRLLASLERPPPHPKLLRAREGEDQEALAALAREPEVRDLAANPERVALLWEVCQIPDFRKTLTDAHTRLLGEIYRFLARQGRLPADWVARQVARLDRTEGDIEALMARIAGTRTWTYVSHRAGWLDDAAHWQERSRALEDKLSDALHERLTQRFVDRRTAVLVRRLRDGGELLGAVSRAGEVTVEGEYVGRLDGFRFAPDAVDHGDDSRPLMNAAQRVLRSEIDHRVRRFAGEADASFALDRAGRLLWHGAPVARLSPGASALSPRVEPLASDLLEGGHKQQIRQRGEAWVAQHVAAELAPLLRLRDADLSGPARGLAYQLVEALGIVPRASVAAQVAALGRADRRRLAELGVRIGSESVYVPDLLRPRATRLRALLWKAQADRLGDPALPPPLGKRGVALPAAADVPEGYYAAIGLRVAGPLAIRADRLEQAAHVARTLARQGPFAATPALCEAAGCTPETIGPVLRALGYRRVESDAEGDAGGGPPVYAKRSRRGERQPRPAAQARRKRAERQRAASPFAKLRELDLGG